MFHAIVPSPLVAVIVPFSLAWEESPSPEGQGNIPLEEHFLSLKGFGGEPYSFLSFEAPWPAWSFNCSGSGPVPRAFTRSGERKAQSRSPGSCSSAPAWPLPCFLCFKPFRCQAPTQRASKSVVPRVKHNEQTQSSGAARCGDSDIVSKQRSHASVQRLQRLKVNHIRFLQLSITRCDITR